MRRLLLENAYQVLVLTQAVLWVMAGYWGHRIVNRWRLVAAEREARSLIENAERDAASLRRAAEVAGKSDALTAREDFEKQAASKRVDLDEKEKRLIARDAGLQEKLERFSEEQCVGFMAFGKIGCDMLAEARDGQVSSARMFTA